MAADTVYEHHIGHARIEADPTRYNTSATRLVRRGPKRSKPRPMCGEIYLRRSCLAQLIGPSHSTGGMSAGRVHAEIAANEGRAHCLLARPNGLSVCHLHGPLKDKNTAPDRWRERGSHLPRSNGIDGPSSQLHREPNSERYEPPRAVAHSLAFRHLYRDYWSIQGSTSGAPHCLKKNPAH